MKSSPDRHRRQASNERVVLHRPTMIAVFAIAILLLATFSSAQSPSPRVGQQLTGTQVAMPPSLDNHPDSNKVPAPQTANQFAAPQTSNQFSPPQFSAPQFSAPQFSAPQTLQLDGLVPGPISNVVPARPPATLRPRYVELFASLSNFDADADPDGWRAEIILRDREDRPVVMRATAKFELMPRVSRADHRQFVNADATPITWTIPLAFDHHGVASVKLPLRRSLQPLLGWNSALHPTSRNRNYSNHPGYFTRRTGSFGRSRTIVTMNLEDRIASPSTGELRVRVSVPTEGVFEAAAPVWIRPSLLVDTAWPYQ